MATVAQIRAAILAKLQGVTGIGKVHDYERFAANEKDFQTLYLDAATTRINGWNFYRVSTREMDIGIGEVRRLHAWRFTGYRGLDDADATGKSFDNLAESIATAFRADRTLGGLIDDNKDLSAAEGESGIQIDGIEPALFAGVLCHRAQLSLLTETTETI